MIELKPCPLCGSDPTIRHFTVNPMFGGGTAYEVKCACGFCDGMEYRDGDAAIECWNVFVDDWNDMDDDDAYLEEHDV